jgi:hypothetical protein
MSIPKITAPLTIVYPEISTHGHFLLRLPGVLFTQTAPLITLLTKNRMDYELVTALLNSSAALFILKQISFNKGAGEHEHRDRFEFAGAKIQQLPIPEPVVTALQGSPDLIAQRLADTCRECQRLGNLLPGLRMRHIFNRGDGYSDWNKLTPSYVAPNSVLEDTFHFADELRSLLGSAIQARDELERQMTALQEEMDWLIYAAFGLVPVDHGAVQPCSNLQGLGRDQRPFRLWEEAGGDCSKAIALIPQGWNTDRKTLWSNRLAVIRENDHVRRIEQPVYKRRWDEQWKVGNQWRCGEIAYAAEFIDAFEWWLKEKAEWWLENKKGGGPAELDEWMAALWADERVQAAWPVAAENYSLLEFDKARAKAEEHGDPGPERPKPKADRAAFARLFKVIVEEETVPEGFEFGTEYGALEKKLGRKIPPKVVKVRGKLNVPRERFHSVGKTQYKWAGLQFRSKVS